MNAAASAGSATDRPAAPAQVAVSRGRSAVQGGVLLLLPLVLIVGNWHADFLPYDDPHHITEHPLVQAEAVGWGELLTPRPNETYFPVTLFSYRVDRALWGWMEGTTLGSWAPGARITNALLHGLAAVALWVVFCSLGVGRGAAWWLAAVWAVHPLNAESVGWLSERKNVLAGCWGFWALAVWLCPQAQGRVWRVPLAALCYTLAVFSKPNALGLLPVFGVLELCNGARGIRGEAELLLKPQRAWLAAGARLLPLVCAAGFSLVLNLRGHAVTIVEPPGGSVYTALLTDAELLVQYLRHAYVPMGLSAAYLIEPILSPLDGRFVLNALLLAGAVAVTVRWAANRRRAVLAWLWVVGALGTNLNLIAISFVFQDRYFLLSLPAALLLLHELALGWAQAGAALRRSVLRVGAAVALALVLVLGLERSFVWRSMTAVFLDAVEKQPRAALAQYGLGHAYAWELEQRVARDARNPGAVPGAAELALRRDLEALRDTHWKRALSDCPDLPRFLWHHDLGLQLAQSAERRGARDEAVRWYRYVADPPPPLKPVPFREAEALRALGVLEARGGDYTAALTWLDEAVRREPGAAGYFARAVVRAEAARAAQRAGKPSQSLWAGAEDDLRRVPVEGPFARRAEELRARWKAERP